MDGLDTDWYDGSRRIPCSMYYDFLIRQNGKGERYYTFAITKEVRTLLLTLVMMYTLHGD